MRLLVIEGEQRMASLLRRGLTEEGHQVFVVRNGREGFDTARSSEFDVIVVDVMLPGLDGPAIARKLREVRNQTPGPDAFRAGLHCNPQELYAATPGAR